MFAIGAASSFSATVKPVGVLCVPTVLKGGAKVTLATSPLATDAGGEKVGPPVNSPWPLTPLASPIASTTWGFGAAAWAGRAIAIATAADAAAAARRRARIWDPHLW